MAETLKTKNIGTKFMNKVTLTLHDHSSSDKTIDLKILPTVKIELVLTRQPYGSSYIKITDEHGKCLFHQTARDIVWWQQNVKAVSDFIALNAVWYEA